MSAATVHQLPPAFDLSGAIHRELEANPGASRDDVVKAVVRLLPQSEVERLAAVAVGQRVGVIQEQIERRKSTSVTVSAPPARPGSSKVDVIRADWRSRLAAYEFEGAFAVPISLLTATRTDLAACAERHAHHVAFLTGVANALDSHRAARVRDLPVEVQQRIAEKIPRPAS